MCAASNHLNRGKDSLNNIAMIRSVFRISCLFLRPRLWQFEIETVRTHKQHISFRI